jgi:glycosyltransferase involved in cell wall biosynthesis
MYRPQIRAWRRAGATVSLIVYDLLPLLTPEFFNSVTVSHFRRWWQFLASEVDQAICISRQVSRDVRERLRAEGAKPGPDICCLELGGDISASRPTTGVCANISQLLDRMRFRPTVLMVGTVEPRKGYDVALNAFEYLWSSRGGEAPDLVIVGKPGWKTEKIQHQIRNHPEHGRRLHWLNQVSDEGLCSLYESGRGLLMASHAEGFGLPLLEAAMHRRHVLARDLVVFREQNLPNVIFFQDDEPAKLGQSIMDLVDAGMARPPLAVDLPTWSESVENLLVKLGLSPSAETDVTSRSVRTNIL